MVYQVTIIGLYLPTLSSAFSLTLSVEATHTLDHVTRRIHSIAVL